MSEQIADMTQIRDEYIEAWAGHFVRGKQGAARYFDQALNGHNLTIEAAAEQRGAVKALREFADAHRMPLIMFRGENYTVTVSDLLQETARDIEQGNRADQMEGDDA